MALIDRPATNGLETALLDGLRAAGDQVETTDLERFLRDGAGEAERLLWLRGVFASEALEPSAEFARFAAALAETAARPRTVFMLNAGASPVGAETLRPEAAARLGPLLSLGQESAPIGVRAVDLDPARPAPVAAVLRELRAESLRPEPLCALRGPHLWVERIEPFAAPDGAQEAGRALLRGGAFAITGGFGRIGLRLAERLAAHGAAILLAGRRPEREAAAVEILRASGARIETVALDIAAPGGAEALLREALDRFGRLDGVFHAAGVADLKYLPETSAESLAAEAAPKIAGTKALARALETCAAPPRFVVAFSSLAAPLGGLGMSGYGGANRFLDLFAEAKAREDGPTRWLSIGWDDWDFDYGREQVGAWARTRVGLSLPPDEALDALETLLGVDGLSGAIVAATALGPRIDRWLHEATRSRGEERGAADAPPQRAAASAEDPALAATLDAYRRTLGDPEIDADSDFFDLGGDSLLATQLTTLLAADLARLAPSAPRPRIADVFDHPTPRRLARRLGAAEKPSDHGAG